MGAGAAFQPKHMFLDSIHGSVQMTNKAFMSHATPSQSIGRVATILGCAVLLQACVAPPVATDIADNWKPVNSLGVEPQEIPLKEEVALHKYQMLPTDSSLRNMLERWAKESDGSLDWQYPADLTLVSGLSAIKDNNLQRALGVVRRTYAAQKLRVQVSPNKSMLVTKLP
jgi:hypothetical protein